MPPNINFHVIHRTNSKKLNITYKLEKTKFGNVLVGYLDERICHISFQDGDVPNFEDITRDFPRSTLKEGTESIRVGDIFDDTENVEVVLTGTEFQVKIWKALTEIDKGDTVSYERMAEMIGNPNAVRSVANAVARNKIAYVIPCHRVIGKNGKINRYRWGVERKKMLLDYDRNETL